MGYKKGQVLEGSKQSSLGFQTGRRERGKEFAFTGFKESTFTGFKESTFTEFKEFTFVEFKDFTSAE